MKNEKLYPKEKQKGVVFYRHKLASQDMSENPENIDAIDIDVDDEVKEVVICYDLIMPDSKKSFPNVESLVIKSNVFEIRIPNTLFPNVKWVQSESHRFKTGNCLVLNEGDIFFTLFNTFCKKEGEVIETDDITAIKNEAFSGCESTNLTSAFNACCGDDIEPDAFAGSAFAKQPFIDGVKMAGNIVIDIDKTTEEIIIPDDDYEKAVFIANIDFSGVKKLVVHRYETARQVNYDTNFPEMLVLNTNDSLSGVEVRELAHISSSEVSYLKYFSISSQDYKTIDEIVYTKSGKMVVAGSLGLEYVVIPEGVEKLGHSAFRNCKMISVVLPDSIDRIGAKAFCQCENLKSVKLGTNVDAIEDSTFAECCSLKHIDIPAGIKTINDYAFLNSGLESIELHEGLLCLGHKAFSGTNIESIHLPASIKKLGYNCLGSNLKELTMETFPAGFGAACIIVPSPFDADNQIIKVYCNGKHLYLPRRIKPSMSSYAIDEIEDFFKNPRIRTVSMYQYAFSISCQGKVALLEYLDFGSESAREHIKKYSYYILSDMIQEGSEEFAAKMVETGLVSNGILQKMLPKAENAEMFTLKAYMLNQLNLNGVQEEKISYAI